MSVTVNGKARPVFPAKRGAPIPKFHPMDRRSFLRTSAAASAAAVLPLPLPAPAKAATAGVGVASYRFAWASLFARVHGSASPALLMKWFGIRAETAQALMGELSARGVIGTTTTATGRVLATKPMYMGSRIPGVPTEASRIGTRVKEALRGEVERVLDAAPDSAPPDSPGRDGGRGDATREQTPPDADGEPGQDW